MPAILEMVLSHLDLNDHFNAAMWAWIKAIREWHDYADPVLGRMIQRLLICPRSEALLSRRILTAWTFGITDSSLRSGERCSTYQCGLRMKRLSIDYLPREVALRGSGPVMKIMTMNQRRRRKNLEVVSVVHPEVVAVANYEWYWWLTGNLLWAMRLWCVYRFSRALRSAFVCLMYQRPRRT